MVGNSSAPKENEQFIDLLRAERDYEYIEDDIFDERDERVRGVLQIISSELSKEERRLLILYAECGSNYSKAARQVGVTPPTFAAAVKAIIAKVRKIYKERYGHID